MARIFIIPKCYVGYALWVILFATNAYTIYWFATYGLQQHFNSNEVTFVAIWFIVGGIFGTVGNAIFTAVAIHDLDKRYHFIHWYGIGFKMVSCDKVELFRHQHEWDFDNIIKNRVICKFPKCFVKRDITPEEQLKYGGTKNET